MAFKGLCRAKELEPIVKVFAKLHRLALRKDDEFWLFQEKPRYVLLTNLPSSFKNWKDQFFILRSKDPCGFEGIPQSFNYLAERPKRRIALTDVESTMVKELKSQANSCKYSCLDVIMAKLK